MIRENPNLMRELLHLPHIRHTLGTHTCHTQTHTDTQTHRHTYTNNPVGLVSARLEAAAESRVYEEAALPWSAGGALPPEAAEHPRGTGTQGAEEAQTRRGHAMVEIHTHACRLLCSRTHPRARAHTHKHTPDNL